MINATPKIITPILAPRLALPESFESNADFGSNTEASAAIRRLLTENRTLRYLRRLARSQLNETTRHHVRIFRVIFRLPLRVRDDLRESSQLRLRDARPVPDVREPNARDARPFRGYFLRSVWLLRDDAPPHGRGGAQPCDDVLPLVLTSRSSWRVRVYACGAKLVCRCYGCVNPI